ncbi:hypothetical protein C8Q77DRAFT_1916 [Trametes polyzona]|nr:hypothetical protein C8Q77DRAFT_1916 [Trametes polyzona]
MNADGKGNGGKGCARGKRSEGGGDGKRPRSLAHSEKREFEAKANQGEDDIGRSRYCKISQSSEPSKRPAGRESPSPSPSPSLNPSGSRSRRDPRWRMELAGARASEEEQHAHAHAHAHRARARTQMQQTDADASAADTRGDSGGETGTRARSAAAAQMGRSIERSERARGQLQRPGPGERTEASHGATQRWRSGPRRVGGSAGALGGHCWSLVSRAACHRGVQLQ